jgi:hypothetical protein
VQLWVPRRQEVAPLGESGSVEVTSRTVTKELGRQQRNGCHVHEEPTLIVIGHQRESRDPKKTITTQKIKFISR